MRVIGAVAVIVVCLAASYGRVADRRADDWRAELPASAGVAKLASVRVRPLRCGFRCERVWATYSYRVNGGGKIVVWFDHPGDASGNHILHFEKFPAQGTSASGRDPQGLEAEGPQARSPSGDAPL